MKNSPAKPFVLTVTLISLVSAPVLGIEIVDKDGNLIPGVPDSTLSFGVCVRTDEKMLDRNNATLINYDNGNLNYDQGDIWSAPIEVVGELDEDDCKVLPDLLFDTGQDQVPDLLPSDQPTHLVGVDNSFWTFRYWPETGLYVAVNLLNFGVYALGGAYGSSPQFVDPLNTLLPLKPSEIIDYGDQGQCIPKEVVEVVNEGDEAGHGRTAYYFTTVYNFDDFPENTQVSNTYKESRLERISLSEIQTDTVQTTTVDGVTQTVSTKTTNVYSVVGELRYLTETSTETTISTPGFEDLTEVTQVSYPGGQFTTPANGLCLGAEWYIAPAERIVSSSYSYQPDTVEVSLTEAATVELVSIDARVTFPDGEADTYVIKKNYQDRSVFNFYDVVTGQPVLELPLVRTPATDFGDSGVSEDTMFLQTPGSLSVSNPFRNLSGGRAAGTDGDDEISPDAEDPSLRTTGGDDEVFAAAGADKIFTGGGDDFVSLGVNDKAQDVLVPQGSGHVTIDNFEPGIDRINLTELSVPVTVEDLLTQLLLWGPDRQFLDFGDAGKLFFEWLEEGEGPSLGDFELPIPDIDVNIVGTPENDRLEGGSDNDAISGLDGNDELFGGPGYNILDGGAGFDIVNYDSAQFDFELGVEVNLTDVEISFSSGLLQPGETRNPNGGIDELIRLEAVFGSDFDDVLYIGNGADTGIEVDESGDFNFLFVGGDGGDELYSIGDVNVEFAPGFDGGGTNVFSVDHSGGGVGSVNFSELQFPDASGNPLLTDGAAIVLPQEGSAGSADLKEGGAFTVLEGDVLNVVGTDKDDTILGNEQDNRIAPGDGDDTILTGGGNDIILLGEFGDGESDTVVLEGSGNVTIFGFEPTRDLIDLSQLGVFLTEEYLNTQLEAQRFSGEEGDQFILELGSAGTLTITYGFTSLTLDNFVLPVPADPLDIDGTPGDDMISPTADDPAFRTGYGPDTVSGGDGNDLIDGGPGNDILFGQEGNDDLLGGPGNNILDGGAGLDSVDYDSSQFFSGLGIEVNLTDFEISFSRGVLQSGQIRNPDGDIDELIRIEAVSGTAFNDVLYIGNGEDTDIDPDEFGDFNFYIDGRGGNDEVYAIGDVNVFFAPGFSADGIGVFSVDPNSGGIGTFGLNDAEFLDEAGNLLLSDGARIFLPGQGEDGFAELKQGGASTVLRGEVRNAAATTLADEIAGNSQTNRFAVFEGADLVFTGGGNDIIDIGLLDDSTDTVVLQGIGNVTVGNFEPGIDKIDLTELGVFITSENVEQILSAPEPSAALLDFGSAGGLFVVSAQAGERMTRDDIILPTSDADAVLSGTLADETFSWLADDLAFLSGSGNDTIDAAGGNDVLLGYAGDDQLLGGDGNDRLAGGQGDDILNGGDGVDSADYSGGQFLTRGGVEVNFTGGPLLFQGGELDSGEARDPDGGIDTFVAIEEVIGTSFNDIIVTGNGADTGMDADENGDFLFTFDAGEGADALYVRGTIDVTMLPGLAVGSSNVLAVEVDTPGVVTIDYSDSQFVDVSGASLLTDGAIISLPGEGLNGSAALKQGGALTFLLGNVRRAEGTSLNDDIYGSERENFILGNDGADRIFTGGGSDIVFLGLADEAADTLTLQGVGEVVVAEFEPGFDKIDLRELNSTLTPETLEALLVEQDEDFFFLDLGAEGTLYVDGWEAGIRLSVDDFILAE